jgi:DNA processing protein
MSEFALGTPPLGSNFPRRNRIISGMSSGCLIVEAALKSGSLITARQALEQGREVFAIPGSIHSPLSRGCHSLIKQGAKLVENAQDILDELGLATGARRHADQVDELNGDESVLKHLGYDAVSVDALCQSSGLTVETVSAMLLSLELDGTIASLPGGFYQRIR